MTALPIVRRELLVAGRQRWTYWTRCLAALLLLLLGLALAAFPGRGTGSLAALPRMAFVLLSSTVFAGALLACLLLNADTLATERKEGTLGLLFLTELGGLDIAFGKLTAASIQGFCALLATFPILALPLMMGGVAWTDFWCTAMMLAATLVCSAGIGLWASSRASGVVPAYSLGFFALAALCLLPVFAAWAARRAGIGIPGLAGLELLSPTAGLARAWTAGTGLAGTRDAAVSALLAAGIGVAGLAAAAWNLQCTGRTGLPARARKPAGTVGRDSRSGPPGRVPGNPYAWLYSRRLLPARGLDAVFVLGWLAGASFVVAAALARSGPAKTNFIIAMLVAYGVHVVFKIRTALMVLGPWFEDASGGGLELLLSTPLSPEAIRAGHGEALRDGLRWRRGLLVALALGLGAAALAPRVDATGGGIRTVFAALFLGGVASSWADVYCLRRHGMWLAMRSRKLNHAVARALVPILLPPWIGALVVFLCANYSFSEDDIAVVFVALEIVQIGLVLALGSRASLRLDRHFRALAASRAG